jgi:hypothetical protein
VRNRGRSIRSVKQFMYSQLETGTCVDLGTGGSAMEREAGVDTTAGGTGGTDLVCDQNKVRHTVNVIAN